MRLPLLTTLAAAVAAVTLAACGGSSSSSSRTANTSSSRSSGASATPPASATASGATTAAAPAAPVSYEGVPIQSGGDLASPSSTQAATVDGIRCGSTEQLAYHIHAHLAVFANGTSRALPAGIGIPGSTVQHTGQGPIAAGGQCIYWLHTHTADGIIHIESPTQRVYTLGNFFDVWNQPLSATQVGAARGRITAFVNGQLWRHNVRSIPLIPHGLIQLNIGQPAAPLTGVTWSQTGL